MGDQHEVIPLPNTKKETLAKVIEWAIHHKDDAPPNDDATVERSDEISVWDANFMKVVDVEEVIQLMMVSKINDCS
jgi:S-phase kinase-associated protein 1